MAERFSAFSFVDRITKLEPGARAAGHYAIPAHLPHFPACLVSEAIGQLAAWVAMSHFGFRRRPVAGLASEALFFGGVTAGQTLDLAVALETCDEDAIAYGGSARVDGGAVVELRNCVAPMLPMEEFDAPEMMQSDFEVLCGPGAPAARIRALPQQEVTVIDRVPGKSLTATLQVPESASFFGDHFPRRPVFPGTLLLDQQIELALQLAATQAHPRRAPHSVARDGCEDALIHRTGPSGRDPDRAAASGRSNLDRKPYRTRRRQAGRDRPARDRLAGRP